NCGTRGNSPILRRKRRGMEVGHLAIWPFGHLAIWPTSRRGRRRSQGTQSIVGGKGLPPSTPFSSAPVSTIRSRKIFSIILGGDPLFETPPVVKRRSHHEMAQSNQRQIKPQKHHYER